jgi:raffinose/stachyose/melibiose transport system substrate-binding protein
MDILHSLAIKGIVLALTIIFAAVSAAINLPEPELPAPAWHAAGSEPMPESGPLTVTILQRLEDASYSLQQVCGLYSEESPDNAKFLIRTVSGGSDYEAAFRAALLSGEGADLFQIEGAREFLAYQDHISPLNLSWASSAVAGVAEPVTLEGQVFALPYSVEGFGFVLNRDMFESAGVALPPAGMPALIPELRTAGLLNAKFSELREAINAGKLEEDFPALEAVAEFPAHDDSFLSGGFLDILSSGAFESSLAAAATPANMVFPAAADAEELVKLMKLSPEQDQTERLARGQVAVILADTDIYKRVNEINPDMQGRLRLLPIPLGIYEQPSVYVSAKCFWAINAACEPQTALAARDFLTWLYRSPQGTEALAETLEVLSPYRETAQSTEAALHAHLLSCMDAGLILPRFARELDPVWKKDVFSPAIRGWFTEPEKTWQQALADAGIQEQIID